MKVVELTNADIFKVYHEHLKRDFPSNELKPLFAIRRLVKRKLYHCFVLYDETTGVEEGTGSLLAYAFLFGNKDSDLLLLDYYAVVPHGRQKGLGSQFLALLGQELSKCDGMAAEIESMETAIDAEDLKKRQRRLDFYLRNGFRRSKIRGWIFGVEYETVYWPLGLNPDDHQLLERMNELYRAMVPKALLPHNVAFRLLD